MSTSATPPADTAPASDRRRSSSLRKRVLTALGMPLVAALEAGLRRAPHSWLAPLAHRMGAVGRRLSRRRMGIADHNLRLAYAGDLPEDGIRRILDGIADHAALMLLEILWVGQSAERLKWLMRVEGMEHVRAAREAGRGAICWGAHLGNWELAGCRLAAEGFPVFAFIRRRESRRADAAVEALRRNFGIEPVPLDAGVRALARLLKQNWVFGFVADSPAPEGEGQRVELMGHPCYLWPTGIVLSLMTGAPVLPSFSWREPDGHHVVRICPPIEIEPGANTRETVERDFPKLVAALEEHLRAHPDQWAWFYERWHTDPGPQG